MQIQKTMLNDFPKGMFPENKKQQAYLEACGEVWGSYGYNCLRWEDVEQAFKDGLTPVEAIVKLLNS